MAILLSNRFMMREERTRRTSLMRRAIRTTRSTLSEDTLLDPGSTTDVFPSQ
jgi:hypothetical protein